MDILFKKISLACLLCSFSNLVFADPIAVNITGRVIAAPCELDTASSTLNVDLGQSIQDFSLATANSSSTEKVITLKLINCPTGMRTAIASFSGEIYPGSTNVFNNTGTASNVGVQVKDEPVTWSNAVLPSGGSTISRSVSNSQALFTLRTRAFTPTGKVMAGTISTVMNVTFTYQ